MRELRKKGVVMALAAFVYVLSCPAVAGTTIAYWPFGESGLNDASGNGHTLEGGATIDDHATLGGTAATVLSTVEKLDLSGYDDVTVEYYIKVKDHSGTASVIEHSASMNDNVGGFQALLNDRDPGDQRASVLINAAGNSKIPCIDSASGPFQNGAWHHVAFVIKSKSEAAYSTSALSDYILSLYIDGNPIAYGGKRQGLTSHTGPTTLRNEKLFIGSRNNSSQFLTGQLDDIRITAGALTPTEFLQKRTGRAPKTVAYYPFGSKGLADASGNGNHLHASATGVTLEEDGAVKLAGGTGEFLQTYAPLDLRSYTDGLTIECYFKTTQTDKRPLLVHAPANNLQSVDKPIVIFAYNQNVRTFTRNTWDGTRNDDMSNCGGLSDGQWHRLAYVFDPSATDDTVKLYVDGTYYAQTDKSIREPITGFGNGFLSLGRDLAVNAANYTFFASAGQFVGEIDDVRITDAALAPADFLTARTTEAGEVTEPPTYAPATLTHWKFGRHAELEDETGMNPLTMSRDDLVTFEDGAAVFSGLGSLAARLPPDLVPYDKLTIEFYVNYPKLREGDTGFEMNFLQTRDALDLAGHFRFASDAGYMSSPARAGVLLMTASGGKYKGDMYESPHYGDGQWHHWVYRYDRSGEKLVTDLTVDGTKVPADNSSFKDTTLAKLRSDSVLFVGGRDNATTLSGWKTSQNLYGRMDDIRISAGWLETAQQLSERSVDPVPVTKTIARWDFDSDTPQKDASGTYELRSVTGEGVPVFEDGKMVFPGSAGAETRPVLSYANMKAVTIETVFRADAPYEKDEMLFELGANYTDYGSTQFFCQMTENGDLLSGLNGNYRRFPGRFIRKGEWNHLALVIDSAASDRKRQVTLYVNGEKASEGVWTASVSTLREDNAINVGARTITKQVFVGAMDGFAVTEGALGPGSFSLSRPAPADPETGVVAYWPFGNGKPCLDKTGHGHDFAPAGVVSSGDGALKLAGTGVSTLGYIPFNCATAGLTVECFLKADTAAEMTAATLFKTTSGVLTDTVGALGVELANGALVSKWESGQFTDGAANVWRRENADTTAGTSAVFADGGWHHVALVVDPSVAGHDRAVLYVDGAKMAVVADADGDRDQAFVNGIVTVGEGFFGEIDDLRITARALAPSAFLQERTPSKGAVILFR